MDILSLLKCYRNSERFKSLTRTTKIAMDVVICNTKTYDLACIIIETLSAVTVMNIRCWQDAKRIHAAKFFLNIIQGKPLKEI